MDGYVSVTVWADTLENALAELRNRIRSEAPNAIGVHIKFVGVDMDLVDTHPAYGCHNYEFEYKTQFVNRKY